MRSEQDLPGNVELIPAGREHEEVLANLLEFYVYDFSEFIDAVVESDGRFHYPSLSLYWQDKNRLAFLVKMDGDLAGLVLIAKGSLISGDPEVWDMAEFFIMRRYRRRGVGVSIAHEVWRRLPGMWEVRVIESNTPALAFWKAAVGDFTGCTDEGYSIEQGGKLRRVFSFRSSGTGAGVR
jgi:predicted acetyltransferase